jgi:hypothetical protein
MSVLADGDYLRGGLFRPSMFAEIRVLAEVGHGGAACPGFPF